MKRHHPDIIESDAEPDPLQPVVIPTNRDKQNPLVIVQGPYYKVSRDLSRIPLDRYIEQGYGSRKELYESIEELVSKYGDKLGECIEKRLYHDEHGTLRDDDNTVLHLRFLEPGGSFAKAWVPRYMTVAVPTPPQLQWIYKTENEMLLDEIDDAMHRKHRHRIRHRKQ